MAIPWILKQRIKFNPNIINSLKAELLTEEVITFAMQRGFDMEKSSPRLRNNENFVRSFIKTDQFKTSYSYVLLGWNNFSDELKDLIITRVIENEINVEFPNVPIDVWKESPRLLINQLERNEQSIISNSSGESILEEYSSEDINRIFEILKNKNIKVSNLYYSALMDSKIVRAYLREDFTETVDQISDGFVDKKYFEDIKACYMENLFSLVGEYQKIRWLARQLHYDYNGNVFSKEEQNRILEAARIGNFCFTGNENRSIDGFLINDVGVNFNSIINSKDIYEFSRSNLEMDFTEEQYDKIADKLLELTSEASVSQHKKFYSKVNENEKIINRMVDKNPYVVDFLGESLIFYHGRNVKPFEDGEYIPNDETTYCIYEKNKRMYIDKLRRDFGKMVDRLDTISDLYLNLDELREVYEIVKENGYVIDEDSPYSLKRNPYIYLELVQRGNEKKYNIDPIDIHFYKQIVGNALAYEQRKIEKEPELLEDKIKKLIDYNLLMGTAELYRSWLTDDKKIIETPEFAMASLKKNFISAIFYSDDENCDFEEFSANDLKTIAEEFEKNKINYPKDLIDRFYKSRLISDNPYVFYNMYMQDDHMERDSTIVFPDELYREMADKFKQNKDKVLGKDNLCIERSNPYLIIDSINADPASIDNIVINSNIGRDKIVELIINNLRNGNYKLSEETPIKILRQPEIIDYIVKEGDINQYRFLGKNYKYTEEQKEIITQNVLREVNSGQKINYVLPKVFSEEMVAKICRLNPNNCKFIDLRGISSDNEVYQIIRNSIIDGTFVIDENIPYNVWNNPICRNLLLQNPNSILFADNLKENELVSCKKRIKDSMRDGTLQIGNYVCTDLFYNITENEDYIFDEEFYNYCLDKNPKIIEKLVEDYALRSNNSEIETNFIEYIRKGQMKFDDNTNWKCISVSNKIFLECLKQNREIINHPKVRIPELSTFTDEEKVELESILGENFTRIFGNSENAEKKDNEIPVEYMLSHNRIFKELRKDPTKLDKVNPAVAFKSYNKDKLVQIALENGYVLNENSHSCLRSNNDLIYRSVLKNPTSIRYAFSNEKFATEMQKDILEALMKSKTPIVLNENSLDFLKENPKYILYSLQNAKDEEVKEVIDSIVFKDKLDKKIEDEIVEKIVDLIAEGKYDYSTSKNIRLKYNIENNIDRYLKVLEQDIGQIKNSSIDLIAFTPEEQEKIYNLYLKNKEENDKDLELVEAMKKNSFFVMDYVRNNPDKLLELDYRGLRLTDEFKKEATEIFIKNNYVVDDNTPAFLRSDKRFVYNYIISNNGELNGLSLNDVGPLLDFNEIKEHPEYLQLEHYYDVIKTKYQMFFDKWGKDKTFEFAKKFGNLIKYMDPNQDIDLDNVENEFEVIIYNRNDLSVRKIEEILSIAKLKVSKELFENNPRLKESDRIFFSLLDKNPEIFDQYTGNNEKILKKGIDIGFFSNRTIDELDDILKINKNYTSSTDIFNSLLDEYGSMISDRYTGNNEEIIERILHSGYFDEKDENEVLSFIRAHSNFAMSDKLFEEFLKIYSVNIVIGYNGNNDKIFDLALENGLNVDLDFFRRRADLIRNEKLFQEGVKKNKYCKGLRIHLYNGDREKIVGTIKSVIGEENYSRILPDSDTEDEIIKLSTICNEPIAGVNFLKCLNYDLIKELSFEGWKKLIKYSINNPEFDKLIDIIDKGEISQFMDIYKSLSSYIDDDKALGVNKFIKFANFYNSNSELLQELSESVKSGIKLSEKEKSDFYVLMYSKNEESRVDVKISDLGRLTEVERDKKINRLEDISDEEAKEDLSTFLFNMGQSNILDLFDHDINTQIILQIVQRAQKDKNQELEVDAKYMYVLIDMIEQFYYSHLDENFKNFAKSIYESDIDDLAQIRKTFSNISELVRKFYEREAQSELTNISELMKNPEFVEMDGDDIIVDVSNCRHTLYGHVLGTSVEEFFTRDNGKVTICVSPETDKQEAYYGGDKVEAPIIGIDSFPTGAFIGSAVSNMGSNGSIKDNDYSDTCIKNLYNQTSIRNSYSNDLLGSGHGETLLYRQGLEPHFVIMRRDQPSDIEREIKRQIEAYVNKGLTPDMPKYKKIPFVRTQHHKNRVFKYERKLPESMIKTETGTRQEERIDELRKKFSSIYEFQNDSIIERKNRSGSPYVILDDEVYIIQDKLTDKQKGAMIAASKLQRIIHDDSKNVIDIRNVITTDNNGQEEEKIAIRDIDARSMWTYNRKNGSLSHKSNKMFLQEFLIDHLMCNYDSENDGFLLDEDENVYGIDRIHACDAISDFEVEDGKTYTGMSYYYFDSNRGNNIYRKIFEKYVMSAEGETIFSDKDLQEFTNKATEISEMEDAEYLELYKEMLSSVDFEERKRIEKVLLERKKNVGEDSKEFVDRIKRLRQIEQNPEVIEDPNSIAFINDIHGNAEALQALLEDCRNTGKRNLFVLGDMIGFGPQSNECLDLLRNASEEFNIRCVLGNHELYSLMGNKSFESSAGFQPEMTSLIRHGMSKENRRFIESLPITRKIIVGNKNVELTHFPIREEYEEDSKMYMGHYNSGENFITAKVGKEQDILIYGHEHRTESTIGDEVGTVESQMIGDTEFINLPSSGCVHGKRTSYVTILFDNGKIKTNVHSVNYDREKFQKVLIENENRNAHFFGGIKKEGDGSGER